MLGQSLISMLGQGLIPILGQGWQANLGYPGYFFKKTKVGASTEPGLSQVRYPGAQGLAKVGI